MPPLLFYPIQLLPTLLPLLLFFDTIKIILYITM